MSSVEFPYIKSIHVNDCFTYKNLNIVVSEDDQWRHLILTGRNGSGKTTILKGILAQIRLLSDFDTLLQHTKRKRSLQNKTNEKHQYFKDIKRAIDEYDKIVSSLDLIDVSDANKLSNRNDFIFSFFQAYRQIELNDVSTVTKETEFSDKIKSPTSAEFTGQFKQYLVNKKVFQVFDVVEKNNIGKAKADKFFETFLSILREVFQDKKLELKFVLEEFEFYIVLSDGREITFNVLSEGFSAFLNIIMDILLKVDLIRKAKNDYSFDPPGIVIIDEPETHLHLEMQYQVLPILTQLFPNIQFIAATHSPAVISSITNATVYDLSSNATRRNAVSGSSFSELMVTHFGLDNEFSPVADKVIEDINKVLDETRKKGTDDERKIAKEKLLKILTENEEILTPSLKLEIEAAILQLAK